MKKIKNYLIALRFGTTQGAKATRNEAVLTSLATIFILFGCTFAYKSYQAMNKQHVEQTTYKSVAITPNTGIKRLKTANKQHKSVTLILYRTDCPACKRSEKTIVKNINRGRKDHPKHLYLIFDIKNLSTSQFNYLSQSIPAILIKGNHIPTPLIANLAPHSGKWILQSQSNSDSTFKINAAFSYQNKK